MTERFERAANALVVVAALALAVSVVHHEFFASDVSGQRRAPQKPVTVKNWPELLRSGTLIGDSSAAVKIVEFGDFECPFCRRFEQSYDAARRRFGHDVALVFVEFPLSSIHRSAAAAARAAECAGSQGRFEAFHDLLYQQQDSLGLKSWSAFSREARVPDEKLFEKCVKDTIPVAAIEKGRAIAKEMGIQATPTIVLNGMRYFAPPDDSTLEAIITSELAKARRG